MENNEHMGPETNNEVTGSAYRPFFKPIVERMFDDLRRELGQTTGEESDENSNGGPGHRDMPGGVAHLQRSTRNLRSGSWSTRSRIRGE